MNITLLINKYLLFPRHKVRKVSAERRKLTRNGARSSWVTRRFLWTQDLKLRPSKHTTASGFFLQTLTGPEKGLGGEAPSRTGDVPPSRHHQRTACACWCHHLKEAGHFRTARLAALPPQQDTKGPRLTGFTPPYPLKNTDPFHLTNVRRGLGKPQVRVPAPQCPSWRTFLVPSLTKSKRRPLLTRLLGRVPGAQHITGAYVNQPRFIILIPVVIIQHRRDYGRQNPDQKDRAEERQGDGS